MSYQEVKYKMISLDNNSTLELLTDPKNWNEAEKTLKRSTKTYGVYTELSKNLEFSQDGADFLRVQYEVYDIEARVILEEYRIYPNQDGFYLHSSGTFDFSGYSSDKNYVKIPFKSGGLNAEIKAQLREKFELERIESLNGVELSEFTTKTVALTSRQILFVSQFQTPENYEDLGFNNTVPYRTPFLNVLSNSDVDNIRPVVQEIVPYTAGSPDVLNFEEGNYFYGESDVSKTVNVTGNLDFKIRSGATVAASVYIYVTDNNNNVSQEIVIYQSGFVNNQQFVIDINETINLVEDDNMALVIVGYSSQTQSNSIKYNKSTLTVTEDSIRPDSNSKFNFMHEVGDRLMQIITGQQNKFYSEFYGRTDLGYDEDGEFSKTALALGFWIRKFDDEKIEVSLKDFLETSNSIHNTGYGIETINGEEQIVVEDLKYFFQNEVGIVLTEQVSNVRRKAVSDMYYANMSYGYKKPKDDRMYEEAMGLDEYNTNTSYTNPITRVDKKYDKVCKYRADAYGKEFARRKPKLNFPEQDTRYDKDIFILDLKDGLGDAYLERIWSDDYEVLPTGVFSPETATNLRLTPYRNSQRHEWFYGSGLVKFPEKFVRFANSLGNSELVTKKVGEVAKAENGNNQINTLQYPKFSNQWIEFEYPVDYFVNEMIYGTTEINGRQVPNYYCKLEFINEFGQKEYGYLFTLKPNGNGNWKVLKAY
jgi:hypothetical protein